jgi:hypothetical protein
VADEAKKLDHRSVDAAIELAKIAIPTHGLVLDKAGAVAKFIEEVARKIAEISI